MVTEAAVPPRIETLRKPVGRSRRFREPGAGINLFVLIDPGGRAVKW